MTQGMALLLSLATEAAAAAIFVSVLGWGSGVRAAAAAVIGTLATHWLAWWLAVKLIDSFAYVFVFVGIETGVVLAESLAYRFLVPLRGWRSVVTSLVANSCSAALGLVLSGLNLT